MHTCHIDGLHLTLKHRTEVMSRSPFALLCGI